VRRQDRHRRILPRSRRWVRRCNTVPTRRPPRLLIGIVQLLGALCSEDSGRCVQQGRIPRDPANSCPPNGLVCVYTRGGVRCARSRRGSSMSAASRCESVVADHRATKPIEMAARVIRDVKYVTFGWSRSPYWVTRSLRSWSGPGSSARHDCWRPPFTPNHHSSKPAVAGCARARGQW
jgi:hypothetical protein